MGNKGNFILGIILFTAGSMIYVTGRQNSQFYLSQLQLSFILPQILIFSSPAFFHTLSMILISSPFIQKKNSIILLCFFWTTTQIFFEIGQKYPDAFTQFLPESLYHINNYFKNGTYDPKDIGMAVAGGFTGMFLLLSSLLKFFIIKKGNFLCQKKIKT